MKALLALVPVTFFALASCGSDNTQPSSSGDPEPTSGNGPVKTCRPTCNTANDCATPGQPLQDVTHYSCTAKRCEWLGCQSDTDCTSATMSNKVACASVPGAATPTCVPTCTTKADCAVQGNSLGNSDHFACNNGQCEWLGCSSTQDCQTALQSNKFICEKPAGSPLPTCVPTCTTSADCAVSGGGKLYDANHFTCKAGRCEWHGCKSTAECAADLQVSNVVCE